MRQTLFLIPQSWLEGPLLIAWLLAGLIILAVLIARKGWGPDAIGFLPVYVVVAAALYFVAPRIGIMGINPEDPNGPWIRIGLAIRGYGVLMLAGIVAGVGLSVMRGRQEGIDSEKIIGLAFWMCIFGVIGARLFYVIQKRDHFDGSLPEMLAEMVNMTQGGLVVYGSLIGATLGGAIYCWRSRISALKMADIAAPGMLVGLALGRIGCLMNGCCFGGVCDLPQIAQSFPAGSPPYIRQIDTGELLGIQSADGPDESQDGQRPGPDALYAVDVAEGSLADRAGIEPGDWFRVGRGTGEELQQQLQAMKQEDMDIKGAIAIGKGDEQMVPIPLSDLPDHSIGVYPTQIIASINAALLAALLWFWYPFRSRQGQVFALLIILYSITRFLLELIRRDELGQFGTTLTISQWVSVLVILGGFVLFAYAPQKVATPLAADATADN